MKTNDRKSEDWQITAFLMASALFLAMALSWVASCQKSTEISNSEVEKAKIEKGCK